MSAGTQAHGIAALGRGNDSELVHMTRGEVAGLQRLALAHGGSLTVNPNTGLVEAGFLESILPMVLGGATMAFTGSPWGAALAGGLGGYATSGGKLTGALTGALGGYGGAGLYSGISGLGAGAAGMEAMGGQGGLDAILSTPTVGDLPFDPAGFGASMPPAAAQPGVPYADMSPFAGSEHAAMQAQPTMPPAQVPAQVSAPPIQADQAVRTVTPQPGGDFTRGLSAAFDDPSKLYKNADGTWNKEFMKNGAMAAAPLLAWGMEPNTLPPGAGTGASNGQIRPYEYSQTRNPKWGQPGEPYFVQSYSAGAPYAAAAGGQVPGMAQGGISSLGHYSDGGQLLRGPGDGMSDSIPASINGAQEARLADSEFVVPADVVSHLGNGSTNAGAKKLYGMMNRVRKARTGTTKQGRQINPDKYVPG